MTERKLTVVSGIHQGMHWFVLGTMVPVITLIKTSQGLTLFQVGLSVAVYSATTMLLEIPTGGLADSIGRRKTYLLSMLFGLITGIAFFFSRGMGMFLVASIGMGVTRALSSGAMDAYFVDAYNEEVQGSNLQGYLAKLELFSLAGVAAGSFFGGLYPQFLGPFFADLWGMTRYYANAAALIVFAGLQLALTLAIIKPDAPRSTKQEARRVGKSRRTNPLRTGLARLQGTMRTSFQIVVRKRVFRLIFGGALVIGLAISILEQYWQPQIQAIYGDNSLGWILGFLTAGYFLSGALGNIVIAGLGKLFKNHYTRLVAVLRAGAGLLFIILALQDGTVGFTVFYFLIFFTVGLLSSPQNTIFHRHTPSRQRSTLLSVESLFFQGGGLISSLALAAVAQHVSISAAWIIAGVAFALSALIYLGVDEYPQHDSADNTMEEAYEFSKDTAPADSC
jgi:MFS family permease